MSDTQRNHPRHHKAQHHDISHHGAEHETQQTALNLVDICREGYQTAAKSAQPMLKSAGAAACDFGEGACDAMFQEPADGLTQLGNHVFHQSWKAPKLVPQPKHPDQFATKAGEVGGGVVDAIVVSKGAGLVVGGLSKLATAGSVSQAAAECSQPLATALERCEKPIGEVLSKYHKPISDMLTGTVCGTAAPVSEKDGYWQNKAATVAAWTIEVPLLKRGLSSLTKWH